MPDSESLTFLSTVPRHQATGSAMHNAPALQEERAGGQELRTCTARVILPKQKGVIGISVYTDTIRNNDPCKAPRSFFPNERNWRRILHLTGLHEAFLFRSALYSEYWRPCKHSYSLQLGC